MPKYLLEKPQTCRNNRKQNKREREREREREKGTNLAAAHLPVRPRTATDRPSPPCRASSSSRLLALRVARAQPSRGHLLLATQLLPLALDDTTPPRRTPWPLSSLPGPLSLLCSLPTTPPNTPIAAVRRCRDHHRPDDAPSCSRAPAPRHHPPHRATRLEDP